jgi:two-component system, cell cycle response regulator DivK
MKQFKNDAMQKVLIIDDDTTNIFALRAVLRSKGWETLAASNAGAGIALLEKDESIGIVLLDMMMPGTDGYEVIGLIREKEHLKDLPVIAVTAQAMKGDREKCLDAGAHDYVSKPIDIDRLLNLLNSHLK